MLSSVNTNKCEIHKLGCLTSVGLVIAEARGARIILVTLPLYGSAARLIRNEVVPSRGDVFIRDISSAFDYFSWHLDQSPIYMTQFVCGEGLHSTWAMTARGREASEAMTNTKSL